MSSAASDVYKRQILVSVSHLQWNTIQERKGAIEDNLFQCSQSYGRGGEASGGMGDLPNQPAVAEAGQSLRVQAPLWRQTSPRCSKEGMFGVEAGGRGG